MTHTQETIDKVCKLRKSKLSFSKIGKQVGLTKNQVLAIHYKYALKINRYRVYGDKSNNMVSTLDRELRPSVPFVKGLTDTRYYVVRHARMEISNALY